MESSKPGFSATRFCSNSPSGNPVEIRLLTAPPKAGDSCCKPAINVLTSASLSGARPAKKLCNTASAC